METVSVRPLTQYHQVTCWSYFREIRRKSSLQEVEHAYQTARHHISQDILTQYPVTRMEMEKVTT